jgi:putative transcriptional regulator
MIRLKAGSVGTPRERPTGKIERSIDVNFMHLSPGRSGSTDILLASYATGGLSRPLHALVGAHLALKSDNRAYVAALEGIAAEGLHGSNSDIATGSSPVAERGRRLAAIFADDMRAPPVAAGDSLLPPPLAAYVGSSFADIRWRSVLPGLREAKLAHDGGGEASLLWIKAGRAMPAHTHHGLEATLVLAGSFSDAGGRYERGDLAIADDDIDHKPVAGTAEDCLCFAVSEGPVRLTGPFARLFNKLLGN